MPGVRWRALPWLQLEGGVRAELYHARVRETLAPRVSGDALAWLTQRTAPV